MKERRGRRRKHLLEIDYWKLKGEALGCCVWATHFGRGYGPIVRENKRMRCWVDELMTHRTHERINFQYFTKYVYVEYKCNTYFVHAFTVGCVCCSGTVQVQQVVFRQVQ